MNEKEKYEIIKRLVNENGNKDRAAMTLGITCRQINRLIKKYMEVGIAAFLQPPLFSFEPLQKKLPSRSRT
ncbi:MAG: hypothetical protein IIY70_01080 [Oscillospiraceae bacterium]|nr:hypothetical protein [Oscillospiraceae bacterium]